MNMTIAMNENCLYQTSKDDVYILTIDGGGMRGVIPLTILDTLSSLLHDLGSDRPLYSYFDLIGGTSTGGLIALALTSPRDLIHLPGIPEPPPDQPLVEKRRGILGIRRMAETDGIGTTDSDRGTDDDLRTSEPSPADGTLSTAGPVIRLQDRLKQLMTRFRGIEPAKVARHIPGSTPKEVLRIYEQYGERIFPKGPFGQLKSFGHVFADKYSAEPLEQLLLEIFQDLTISHALTNTFVVAYDFKQNRPLLLRSYEDGDQFYMRDAARGTSAAPTYFSPAAVSRIDGTCEYLLIDGGVAANNPSLLAYIEARRLFPDARRFHILSLSTAPRMFTPPAEWSTGGFMGWMDPIRDTPLYRIYTTGQYGAVDMSLEALPDVSYLRITADPGQQPAKLDDAEPENLIRLRGLGKKMVTTYFHELDDFSRVLVRNSIPPRVDNRSQKGEKTQQ